MKTLVINLPDETYHWLEVQAAKDEQRIADGVENLLTHLVDQWRARK